MFVCGLFFAFVCKVARLFVRADCRVFILCDYQSPACGLVKYDGEICESTRADRSVALTREPFKIVS